MTLFGRCKVAWLLAFCLLCPVSSLVIDGHASNDTGNGKLTIARLKYEGGGDWYNDPESLPNLARELQRRAGIDINAEQRVVTLNDAGLFSSPILFMTGHGEIKWSEAETRKLRDYLTHSGFLYVDDDYGLDKSFRREMKRVFPDKEFVELPVSHPIYHILYDFPAGLPKHHEHDNKPPQGFGLFHEGRLIVYYTYESNISDGWANPETHNDPPQKREIAFQMGANIISFALTQ